MKPFTAEAVAARLGTRWLGRQSIWLDVVGSTNDEARRAASEGAPEGLLVVSRTQSAGRGRMGRTWMSPLGGLWFSVLLRPGGPPSPTLPLVCGAAVCRAVEAVSSQPCGLKWPNDIVLLPELRKAGGLLLEGHVGDGNSWVVVGIGLNAHVNLQDLDPEVRAIATTISHEDIRTELLAAVLQELESSYQSTDLTPVRERCVTLGKQVRVEWESGQVEGLAVDLDPQGALVVQTPDGRTETIWSCQHCTILG